MKYLPIMIGIIVLAACAGEDLTSEEKSLLITESSVLEFAIQADVEPQGTYARYLYPNENIELEYESSTEGFYISHTISFSSSDKDAKSDFDAYVLGFKTGSFLNDIEQSPMAGIGELGDEVHASSIIYNQTEVGNLLVVKRGKIVHSILLMGHYLEAEQLKSFLTPFFVRAEQV